jgi:hypothetical protein
VITCFGECDEASSWAGPGRAGLVRCDVELEVLLPQLAAVQVEGVQASAELIRITARTREGLAVACPGCGWISAWEHSRYVRHVAEEAVGGRSVVIDVSVRRLYCQNPACAKATFVEQIGGLTGRYPRRTPALQRVLNAVAVALAGTAGARMLLALHQVVSWTMLLGCLLAVPLPPRPGPRVLGVDDCAPRRGYRYSPIVIDARSPPPGWRCWPSAPPQPWPRGCATIPGSRSSAGTARPPTPRPSPMLCPARCRSLIALTCGTTVPPGWKEPSPRAPRAGAPSRPL